MDYQEQFKNELPSNTVMLSAVVGIRRTGNNYALRKRCENDQPTTTVRNMAVGCSSTIVVVTVTSTTLRRILHRFVNSRIEIKKENIKLLETNQQRQITENTISSLLIGLS